MSQTGTVSGATAFQQWGVVFLVGATLAPRRLLSVHRHVENEVVTLDC